MKNYYDYILQNQGRIGKKRWEKVELALKTLCRFFMDRHGWDQGVSSVKVISEEVEEEEEEEEEEKQTVYQKS
jgi:hypothetical protein